MIPITDHYERSKDKVLTIRIILIIIFIYIITITMKNIKTILTLFLLVNGLFIAGQIVYIYKEHNKPVVAANTAAKVQPISKECNTLDSDKDKDSELLVMINKFRISKGLDTLRSESGLNKMAAHKAYEYSQTKEWSHDINGRNFVEIYSDCETIQPIKGYGENLAKDYKTNAATLTGWINSPTHYQVLTNPEYKYIGIFNGGMDIDNYVVTAFGY